MTQVFEILPHVRQGPTSSSYSQIMADDDLETLGAGHQQPLYVLYWT